MHNHLERKGVVANQWRHITLCLSQHRLGRFAVIIDGRPLADADHAVVLDLDDQHWFVRRDAPGDLEGFMQG